MTDEEKTLTKIEGAIDVAITIISIILRLVCLPIGIIGLFLLLPILQTSVQQIVAGMLSGLLIILGFIGLHSEFRGF